MTLILHAKQSGPVFDGRATKATTDYLHAATGAVAEVGARDVRTLISSSVKAGTGSYESHVHADRTVTGAVVTDGGVIYGAWLEGTSSRNQTTRFKGYAAYRKAAQVLDRHADTIAEKVLPPYLKRMND